MNPFVCIDHVNLGIADVSTTETFYCTQLGCVRKQRPGTMHVNCGPRTQFHLPICRDGEQLLTLLGQVVVAYDGPVASDNAISDPQGNVVLQVQASPEQALALGDCSRQDAPQRGVPVGIVEVTLDCPVGTVDGIKTFYASVFGFNGEVDTVDGNKLVRFSTSKHQCLVFREQATFDLHAIATHQSNPVSPHIAIYVAEYEQVCKRALEAGVATVNPRFPHLDGESASLENAHKFNQFRVRDIRDQDGALLYVLEHEVRSVSHPQFPFR